MTPEQSKALRAKVPDHLVSKFPPNAGANANREYLGHAAVTDRLLEVDPAWTWRPLGGGLPAFDDVGGIWIELTVCGVTRIGYGFPERLKGGNAIKEAIGDAIRNAAMRFGVGLEFWFKGDLYADQAQPDSLTEQQLQTLAQLLGQVANQKTAYRFLKESFGTDDIVHLKSSQYNKAFALIMSMPKLTDILPQEAKDTFFKQIEGVGYNPDEILGKLNYRAEGLTYAQKSEIGMYIQALKGGSNGTRN